MNIREKIEGKTPLMYEAFMEVIPHKVIDKEVSCQIYQTKCYVGKKFYKHISIFCV
jgi:hypothetical protein